MALAEQVGSRDYVYRSAIFLTRLVTLFPRHCYNMFSTRKPGLISYSDGMFTRYSASTNRSNVLQNDFIVFLAVVQKCNVDYLPITSQPVLSTLGVGGSGTISLSTFSTEMPLAFKRFHDSEDSDGDIVPLISEILILSQPLIQNHPNIVNLYRICWDIKPRTEKAAPELVFDKAVWDIQQFMRVHEGLNMSLNDRIKVCADIGSAIMALHAYGLSFQMIISL